MMTEEKDSGGVSARGKLVSWKEIYDLSERLVGETELRQQ